MKTRDMTAGDPIRHILAFALPLLIGTLFQQIYSMTDTMIAGYSLGDSAIAAIGATVTLTQLIINSATGLNSGYAIVASRCFGAQDMPKLRKTVFCMFVLMRESPCC